MSFTPFSSSTGQLTQCVTKKSRGPRSGGAPAISGSRTSTLGVTARKPVCGTQAPKPQDTPWLPVPGDVTRALPQRSERGAGRAAPRQMVQLGAPFAARSRSRRWPRRLEALAKPPQCVRFQAHQRPCRGDHFAHPGRQSQDPRLRDHQAPVITIVYLVAGKLTQLPTSPFVVQSGLPLTT